MQTDNNPRENRKGQKGSQTFNRMNTHKDMAIDALIDFLHNSNIILIFLFKIARVSIVF